MILFILRGAFILLTAAVTALYLLSNQWGANVDFPMFVLLLGVTIGITSIIVAIDAWTQHKKLSAISGVFLGLVAGLLAAYALSFVIDLIGVLTLPKDETARQAYLNLLRGVKVVVGLITCYLGISLVLQTKDDFRFVIPYVEFAKETRGNRPIILDTSVIVDGRILDIIQTQVIQGTLIIPRFVLNELQQIADSADKLKRARGRRGLDMLQKLQENRIVEVVIDDTEVEGASVDQKLISLALLKRGRVMTNDYNLNKIASLRGVDVINLNDLAKALRPVVLPGEHLHVKLVKTGEGPNQGVGYLDDGTMVVVEQGRTHIGQEVDLVVTSTLQTSAGRMIFGRFASEDHPASSDGHESPAPGPIEEHPPQPAATTEQTRPTRTGVSGRNPRRAR
ncbi:MAG: TRAM domain-containing protein [Phycisphaeraceae bacterium]